MRGKLIVVSYRLPFRFSVTNGNLKITSSAGGLATALHSFFEKEKAEVAQFTSFHWVGVCDISKKKFEKISEQSFITNHDLVLHPVFIDGHDNDLFYNGFCNSVLWPLFHYFPSYVVHEQNFFDAYQRANQVMAEKIWQLYEPGDTIWIHDYHFMLLPQLLRQKLPAANIGFFLHIPFPAFEIFRILPKPWCIGILEGLLGSSVVGFHTIDYTTHFRNSIYRMLQCSTSYDGITNYDEREILIKSFPISIDFEKFNDASANAAIKREVKKIKNRFGQSKLILSVDRLDYTKAIINRLESFETFLTKHANYREKVTYILLLVPSRDTISKYRENKREVEILISRINGMLGSLTWTPIIYQYRSLDFKRLVALYAACDIALIAPVRDGMNLVAKEYVASRSDLSGVLILSETAGAANELHEAILVNPNDRHEIADSILHAVSQPLDDQKKRIGAMQNHLRQHDVHRWVTDFMNALLQAPVESPH